MPRSNRPRRRAAAEEAPELDLERALRGGLRVERKRDGDWNVQPAGSGSAVKSYSCPGCGREIAPGAAHLVAWRSDGIMGAADDLAGRRHWHAHCWRIRA